MSITTTNKNLGKIIIKWLTWADNDYLASRQLLLTGLIVPGTALANTALEKYFKCLLILLNKKIPKGYKGHDVRDLYNTVLNEVPTLSLNNEFLEFLFKAYKLRYPDELTEGYNIVFIATKALIELDFSVFEIRKGFSFTNSKGNVPTRLELLKDKQSPELVNKNCYYGSSIRSELFKEDMVSYELRVLAGNQLLEAYYSAINVPDDGLFMIEALRSGININQNDFKKDNIF